MRRLLILAPCWLFLVSSDLRAQERFFDSNGVKIHYLVEGKGEPVVLIHGFTVNLQMNWVASGVVKALASDYQVIALDNRGHGQSEKPHDPKKYGLEMVEDVVRLLDHLKIQKAHVVGYSMGGMITAKLIATHPDRLMTATLGGHSGLREGEPKLKFFDDLADSLEQGKGFGALIVALTPPGKPKPTEQEIDAINKTLSANNDTKALAAAVRGFKELTVSEDKLKANQVPTLAVIGDLDPLKKNVDELKDRMANLQIAVIEGADHMNAPGRPEFSKTVKEFLAKSGKKPNAGIQELILA